MANYCTEHTRCLRKFVVYACLFRRRSCGSTRPKLNERYCLLLKEVLPDSLLENRHLVSFCRGEVSKTWTYSDHEALPREAVHVLGLHNPYVDGAGIVGNLLAV